MPMTRRVIRLPKRARLPYTATEENSMRWRRRHVLLRAGFDIRVGADIAGLVRMTDWCWG